ncbi:hypothetical protein N7509_002709 [Penicillium cosmopolitanum]|uniref:RRM domain-containing protein n=1 Tax=Penicillium cosmopolitanum TaxID=1131564 RepID=A0A9X0BDP0_9EURO|nr:uncharacterized protein N7509_002709 [Penicillium cosmopolitanum]KAJ5408826.1 hypothetical protein N7509_002709 [Penicillium cosmopolitanum]
MTELFAEFCPTAIGKRITPHENQRSLPGHHHYCFIDFATREQAANAKDALNGQPFGEDNLKVSIASSVPEKLVNRHTVKREDHPGRDKKAFYRPSNSSSESRAQESNNWRNKN